MTGEEFVAYHAETVGKMNEICRRKNQDYSGDPQGSAFNNFTMIEEMGIATTEEGFLTRMMDKMMRINNIIKSGQAQVKDESVEDTLLDLANYSILLAGYLKTKKERQNLTEGVEYAQ